MSIHFPALLGLAAGTRVLVAGGTGTVGSGVVKALLKQGAKVLVPTRSLEKFDDLQHNVPENVRRNLSVVWGDVSTEKGVDTVLKKATTRGCEVEHVVASIGQWWQKGLLIEQPVREFNRVLTESALPHFLLLKAFVPHLNRKPGTSYTMVTGAAGYKYLATHTSLLCVGAGARNGLAVAARSEGKLCNLAINEFHITCRVHPTEDANMLATDPYNVGHDLIGSAITATIGMPNLQGEKIVVHHRNDAKDLLRVEMVGKDAEAKDTLLTTKKDTFPHI